MSCDIADPRQRPALYRAWRITPEGLMNWRSRSPPCGSCSEALAQMLILSPAPITDTLKAFEEAAAKMSPDKVPVADLDPELHRRAAELAQERARQSFRDIGKLVARKRDGSEPTRISIGRTRRDQAE